MEGNQGQRTANELKILLGVVSELEAEPPPSTCAEDERANEEGELCPVLPEEDATHRVPRDKRQRDNERCCNDQCEYHLSPSERLG